MTVEKYFTNLIRNGRNYSANFVSDETSFMLLIFFFNQIFWVFTFFFLNSIWSVWVFTLSCRESSFPTENEKFKSFRKEFFLVFLWFSLYVHQRTSGWSYHLLCLTFMIYRSLYRRRIPPSRPSPPQFNAKKPDLCSHLVSLFKWEI